jgi:general secretion pathway protein D
MPRIAVSAIFVASFLLAAGCAAPPIGARSAHQSPSPTAGASPLGKTSAESPDEAAHSALLVRGSGIFVRAPNGARTHTVAAANGFQLNFVNTDIKTVVTAVITQGLGLPVVIDPGVSGTISLQSDQPLSESQAMASLELALRSQGFVLVKVSGVFHVMPAKDAVRHIDAIRMSGNEERGFGVYVVPLKFVSAQKMAELVRPFAPEDSIVRADSARNLLVLSGTNQEISVLTGLIRMFDVNWLAGMSFALYSVQYTNAGALADELSKVFAGPNSPIAGVVQFVPLKSINSLLVITPQPKYLPLVQSWIKRFDVDSMTPGRRLYVFNVQNGTANDLAHSLEEIFSLPTTAASVQTEPTSFGPWGTSTGFGSSTSLQGLSSITPGDQRGAPGEASFGIPNRNDAGISGSTSTSSAAVAGSDEGLKIVPEFDNNSLLIYATASEFNMINAALKRLDVLPLEVVINASIAEVTLKDGLQYGLNFSYRSSHGPITLSNSASGSISQQFPGLSFLYTGGTNITAVLNALESITNVRVLSSPKLVVLNNHEAELEVGDEVPIVTQSSVSTVSANAPIVNSVQMLNTGVILQVVPRANESGQVLLDISQQVSDVVPTTTSNIDSPTVEQRQISTTVAVHDGDTIVLGGLIEESKSVGRSGVPYLRRLPILGNLFGSTDNNHNRTELIVLLTPHVVRSSRQMDSVMRDLREQFGELQGFTPE